MAKTSCPACRQSYDVPSEVFGRGTRCKRCGEKFRIARSTHPPASFPEAKPGPGERKHAHRDRPSVTPVGMSEIDLDDLLWEKIVVDTESYGCFREPPHGETASSIPSVDLVPNAVPLSLRNRASGASSCSTGGAEDPSRIEPTYSTSDPDDRTILCYVCKKPVAEHQTCPHCSALQTWEGRNNRHTLDSGKLFGELGKALIGFVVCLPFLICTGICTGVFTAGRSNVASPLPSPPPRGPAGWDREQLERDVERIVRDPSKTIIIPYDGSQPRVVPNPYPPD